MEIKTDDPRNKIPFISDFRAINRNIIIIKTNIDVENAISEIKKNNLLDEFKFIFIVSDDIDIKENVDLLWGIFTRFDPSIDMYFSKVDVVNSSVSFEGQVIIDSTFKPWYPKVIEMSEDVKDMVNKNWKNY